MGLNQFLQSENLTAKNLCFSGEYLVVEKIDGENYSFDGEKLLFVVENPEIKEKPFLCILDHRLRCF